MESYDIAVKNFLFGIGSKSGDKEYFMVVVESYFSGIPGGNRRNLFLIIKRRSGEVFRLLANIDYSCLTKESQNNKIWLSGSICPDEMTKYGTHASPHQFFGFDEVEKVVSYIQQ